MGLYDGTNTYVYVNGNPLMYYDPYGLFSFDPVFNVIYRATGGWSPSQSTVNFSAGLGDALLLGFGSDLRDLAGVSGGVDPCSDAYRYGGYASFAAGGSRLAYAGVVKGYSVIASSGVAASTFRNQAKNLFRLGFGKGWRQPNLSKYATDDALRAAAGRTNLGINAYGAGVAAAGAYGGNGCGCNP